VNTKEKTLEDVSPEAFGLIMALNEKAYAKLAEPDFVRVLPPPEDHAPGALIYSWGVEMLRLGLIQDWGGGRSCFAILPTPARPAQTPVKSRGCKNAQQRRKSPTQPLWRCCPRERTQSFFIPTSTAKQRSAFSRAVCHFLTTAKKPANPYLAQ